MIKADPRVSIGLPVYNAENFLREALDSILAQTFTNFELIICDNASTDNTEKICQEYVAKDQRIHYYRNEQNLGAAINYNRVFELSKGEYFKWANHDDLCAPEFLERCVEVLDQHPSVVLAYPKTILIDEQGKIIQELFNELNLTSSKPHERFIRYHNCTFNPEIADPVTIVGLWMPIYGLIRSNLLKMTRLIGLYVSSDTVLIEELALLGEFYLVPENLFFKREYPGRGTQKYFKYDQRILWFDPHKKGKLLFPQWRLLIERLIIIKNAPIDWREKINCYLEMIRYIWKWKTATLVKEPLINLGRILNIHSIKVGPYQKKLPEYWE